MDQLLNPDIGLMIWTMTTFVLLVVVLGKYAWKPMIRMLDQREEGIRKAVADAEKARQVAEELKAENQNEWARVRQKAEALIKQTQVDAEALRVELVRKTEEDIRRLREQAQHQREQERADLVRELRTEVAGLSVRVAEKLLRHSVNAKENEALVQGFIKDLEKGNN